MGLIDNFNHDVEIAKKAIDRVFSDTSVDTRVTADRLLDLVDHIEAMLASLPEAF